MNADTKRPKVGAIARAACLILASMANVWAAPVTSPITYNFTAIQHPVSYDPLLEVFISGSFTLVPGQGQVLDVNQNGVADVVGWMNPFSAWNFTFNAPSVNISYTFSSNDPGSWSSIDQNNEGYGVDGAHLFFSGNDFRIYIPETFSDVRVLQALNTGEVFLGWHGESGTLTIAGTAVPEPASALLLALGLAGIARTRRCTLPV